MNCWPVKMTHQVTARFGDHATLQFITYYDNNGLLPGYITPPPSSNFQLESNNRIQYMLGK